MNVAQLIARLNSMPQDARVVFDDGQEPVEIRGISLMTEDDGDGQFVMVHEHGVDDDEDTDD